MKTLGSSLVSVFLALLLSCGISAGAAEITLAQAKTAANKWLSTRQQPLGAQIGSTPVAGTTYGDIDGTPLFHVVKLAEGGFVVTSADDGVTPILAFSEGQDLITDDENPLWILLNTDLKSRRRSVENKRAVLNAVMSVAADELAEADAPEAQWAELLTDSNFSILGLSSVADLRVSPLVQSKWAQSTVGTFPNKINVYNYYTPNHYVCGCVATAAAQLMRYYQYPTLSMPPVTKTCMVNGKPTALTTMGGTYAWSDMPLVPTSSISETQRRAIGKLTYDAGVSVEMQYTASASGAYTTELSSSFVTVFDYSNAMTFSMYSYSDTLVQRSVLCNLDAGYPVILSIHGDDGGHAIIGDGYGYTGSTRYVHLNMGWSGTSDAWYNLPNIDAYYTFDTVSAMIYNVFKNKTGELLSGRIVDFSGVPISGATVTVKSGSTVVGTGTTSTTGVYGIHVGAISSSSVTMTVIASYLGRSKTNSATVYRTKSTTYYFLGNTFPLNDGTVGNSWGNDFTLSSVPLPGVPSGVAATDGTSATAVTVSWNRADSATSYQVWRGTTSATASAAMIASGISALTYSDTSAVLSTLYYYWVQGVNSEGVSAFSAYDTGMRALSETSTTPVAIDYSWLDGYDLVVNGDYEAAAFRDTDGDGFQAWQEYVAGTNPTNSNSKFVSNIAFVDGRIEVAWTPDLGSARLYTVYGKTNLLDATWVTPPNTTTRFFKVKVEMNAP